MDKKKLDVDRSKKLRSRNEIKSMPVALHESEWVCKCGGHGSIMGVDDDTFRILCAGCKQSTIVAIHEVANGVDYWAAIVTDKL